MHIAYFLCISSGFQVSERTAWISVLVYNRDQSLWAGKPMTQPLLFLEGRLDKGFSGLDGQKFQQPWKDILYMLSSHWISSPAFNRKRMMTQLAIFWARENFLYGCTLQNNFNRKEKALIRKVSRRRIPYPGIGSRNGFLSLLGKGESLITNCLSGPQGQKAGDYWWLAWNTLNMDRRCHCLLWAKTFRVVSICLIACKANEEMFTQL